MRLTEIGNRITEVLAKYNIRLENAPRDALTMAMDRMIQNRTSGYDYVSKLAGDLVCVPRAQHEAMMMAEKALEGVMTRTSGWQWPEIKTAERALAALRAAGIDLGG